MIPMARIAVVGLIFAALFSGPTIAAPTSRPDLERAPVASPEDRKAEELLDHHLPQVNLPPIALSEALDFVHDVTGANMYVDWKAIELAGVTKTARAELSANDIPLRQVLEGLLKATGSESLEIHVIQGVVVVSTKLNFADRRAQIGPFLAELSDPIHSAAVLDKPLVQVILRADSLDDAYQLLQDLSGVPIVMKWQPMAADGIDRNTPISLDIRKSRLSTVLYFILDAAGDGKLGYVIRPTEIMAYDKSLHKKVLRKTTTITISTIDDLLASRAKATTQPN